MRNERVRAWLQMDIESANFASGATGGHHAASVIATLDFGNVPLEPPPGF